MPANPGHLPTYARQHDDTPYGRPHLPSAFDDPVWEQGPGADEDYPDHGRQRMYNMFALLRDPARLSKIECAHKRTMLTHGPHNRTTYDAAKTKRQELHRLGHLCAEVYDHAGLCPQGVPIVHIWAAAMVDGSWGDLHAVGTLQRRRRSGRVHGPGVRVCLSGYPVRRVHSPRRHGSRPRGRRRAEPTVVREGAVSPKRFAPHCRIRPQKVPHHSSPTERV